MDAARTSSRRDHGGPTAVLAAIVLLGSLALAYTHIPGPACYFRLLLHVPCPGCGLTRSLEALWHGDFLTSFRFHPLGAPLFALCIAAAGHGVLSRSGRPFRVRWLTTRNVLALLAAVWLLRVILLLAGSRLFLS